MTKEEQRTRNRIACRKSYLKHKEARAKAIKDYHNKKKSEDPDYRKAYCLSKYHEHKQKINLKRKEHRKKNPHIYAWRDCLCDSMRRLGVKKKDRTIKLLGYSYNDLKIHLEKLFSPGMSWNNYGKWHVDHIRPVSSFSKDTPMNVVNALSNLQPLWALDNLKKSKKYESQNFYRSEKEEQRE